MTRSSSAAVGLWLFLCSIAFGLPPKPERYMNDFAGVVPDMAEGLIDERLRRFEEETSNQIVVAVFQELEQGAALADFTQRTAASWGVGQEQNDNGIVLFVFVGDRKMRIEVGYGLEGAVPDITAKRIIENEIAPGFRSGNYGAGIEAGVNALIAATRGEYEGTGRANARSNENDTARLIITVLFILLVLYIIHKAKRSGRVYTSTGTFTIGGWGSGGGGGWGGGGFGGGGFSGGGGGFGGGGASGGW